MDIVVLLKCSLTVRTTTEQLKQHYYLATFSKQIALQGHCHKVPHIWKHSGTGTRLGGGSTRLHLCAQCGVSTSDTCWPLSALQSLVLGVSVTLFTISHSSIAHRGLLLIKLLNEMAHGRPMCLQILVL